MISDSKHKIVRWPHIYQVCDSSLGFRNVQKLILLPNTISSSNCKTMRIFFFLQTLTLAIFIYFLLSGFKLCQAKVTRVLLRAKKTHKKCKKNQHDFVCLPKAPTKGWSQM